MVARMVGVAVGLWVLTVAAILAILRRASRRDGDAIVDHEFERIMRDNHMEDI